LLTLWVSQEEALLIPFLYGLDFVHVTNLQPGDFVWAADDQPLTVYERKRDDDLSAGIGNRFQDQRMRLTTLDLPRERVTYLQEAIALPTPRNSQSARVKSPYDLHGCSSNCVQRDGFRWRRTAGMLDTLLLLLRDGLSLVEQGSYYIPPAWHSKQSKSFDNALTNSNDADLNIPMNLCEVVSDQMPTTSFRTLSTIPVSSRQLSIAASETCTSIQPATNHRLPVPYFPPLPAFPAVVGSRPSAYRSVAVVLARMLACVHGVSPEMGAAIQLQYPTLKALFGAYRQCLPGTRKLMLADIRYISQENARHAEYAGRCTQSNISHRTQPTIGNRKIGQVLSRRLYHVLYTGEEGSIIDEEIEVQHPDIELSRQDESRGHVSTVSISAIHTTSNNTERKKRIRLI
jgi:hypothetical protein